MTTTTTIRPVTHKCGHSSDADVSGKKPFEVDGFVKWLEKKPCRDCDPKAKAKREAWVANRRKEELAEARQAETRFGMKEFDGPPKMVEWATRIRVDLVNAAWDSLGLDEDDFAQKVGDPAGEVNAPGWWIDNRDLDPADLAEALTEALGQPVDGTQENPY